MYSIYPPSPYYNSDSDFNFSSDLELIRDALHDEEVIAALNRISMQYGIALGALANLADPSSVPKTEDAALLLIEVEKVAKRGLTTLVRTERVPNVPT